jgi:tRNA A37 threonylcarbamoyladenosine synthetase subunit TsaC/SUA5/YrdC
VVSVSIHQAALAGGLLTNPDDVERAVAAIAAGSPVAYGFANFYALASRCDEPVVRAMNVMKGRPADQVGSVTTSASRGATLFDWSALPDGLSRTLVLDAMDVLFGLGPCGFRGPAAPHIPAHLTQVQHGVPTVQLIGPGYSCPSRHFVARALHAVERDFLYITSANRSHHRTGASDEPAHYRADALAREFAEEHGMVVLAHPDEAAARRAYPLHATTSVTVVSWSTTGGQDSDGRPVLVVERHGSLGFSDVAAALAPLGLGVRLGTRARGRLQARHYA